MRSKNSITYIHPLKIILETVENNHKVQKLLGAYNSYNCVKESAFSYILYLRVGFESIFESQKRIRMYTFLKNIMIYI